MSQDTDHLEEVSTKERMELVDGDNTRRKLQIGLAVMFIVGAISYLGGYLIFEADAEFKKMVAIGMFALLSGGVGAALAIFGLGRTVGRKST